MNRCHSTNNKSDLTVEQHDSMRGKFKLTLLIVFSLGEWGVAAYGFCRPKTETRSREFGMIFDQTMTSEEEPL